MHGTRTAMTVPLLLVVWALPPAPSAGGETLPVRLRSRTIEAERIADASAALDDLLGRANAASIHAIVQFDGLPLAATRRTLAERGIELQGYLPDNAFIARVERDPRPDRLRGIPIRFVAPLVATDKLAPVLAAGSVPAHARTADGRLVLYVEFHREVELDDGLAGLVGDHGAWVLGRVHSLGGAIVSIAEVELEAMARRDEVKWIEPASPAFEELNDGVRAAIGADWVQAPPLGLSGAGVTALVYDSGMVCEFHSDLSGRVVRAETGTSSTHSTHVAGTLAGSGEASGGMLRGVAPAAALVSYQYESCEPLCLYNNPQDLEANYEEGISVYGADLANNSIGSNINSNGYDCELEGDYENTARLVDAIARGSLGRPFASFWSAGNERGGSARCGNNYFTTGIPATAKNNIVVGATFSDVDSITGFSSFGPVDDGRMRPDVVAPGCQLLGDGGVTSLRNCFDYTVMCGTSMSAPAVAGAAALILERLRELEPSLAPPLPSTYKAILAASADDLGTPGPDYIHGYGQVSLPEAVTLVETGTVLEDEITDGGLVTLELRVPEGGAPLRVALAWDDPPGEPLSAVNLVNDLDLRLMGPDQTLHEPFVLDPTAPAAAATAGANRRDNSELVVVPDPTGGAWRLEVEGFHVPEGPQTFSIAANVESRPAASSVAATAWETASRRPVLAQNVPNPFNPSTTIGFEIVDRHTPLVLRIIDASGRVIRVLAAGKLERGSHRITWDGRDASHQPAPSGVYFYELEQGPHRDVRRMVLIR